MNGGPKSQPWGFTLVETMIVLTVTSVILISALALVNGRQDRTRFSVAIGQVQLNIQKYINEVSNGYFPDGSKFTCNANPASLSINASGTAKGQSEDCIFLGKVLQIGQGSDYATMVTFPVAGRRVTASNAQVTTLEEATPRAISLGNGNAVDLSVSEQLDAGLTVKEMWVGTNRSDRTNAIGLLTNLASYEVDNSSLKSGQLMVNLYKLDGMTPGVSKLSDAVKATDDNKFIKVNQVQICYISGTTNQSGLVTIGSVTGGELSVTLDIKDGQSC